MIQERFQAFTGYIAKINRSIRRIKTKAMSIYNLKVPHVSCIYYLYVSGELTATELCEVCDEDKGGISRSIDRLLEDGYIVKPQVSIKKYKAPLVLTEKGKEVGKYLCETIDQVIAEASSGLSVEERKCFYKALGLISKNLEVLSNRED